MIITAAKTSVSIFVYFVDDDSGTSPGEPTTGLLFSDIETGGSAAYARNGALRTQFTLVTLANAGSGYTEGGFILVDDTELPGVYRLDIPDTALATGVDQVVIDLVADSGKNTVMRPISIDITDVDLRDAVRGGMTALPNVNAGSAGGVGTDTDANGAIRIVDGTGAREINTNVGAIALVDLVTTTTTSVNLTTNNDKAGYALSTAGVDLIWDETMAGHVTADTSGLVMNDWQDGGRLDVILDARMAEASIDTTAGAIDVVTLTDTATAVTTVNGLAANVITAAAYAADALTAIEDEVWDAPMGSHISADSLGLANNVARANVAAAGASGTITLDGSASSLADFYNGTLISLVNGTGAGQTRRITDYTVTTQIASIEPNWITNPASGTEFVISFGGNADLRTATQTSVDAIEADTNELQLDWVNTGRLDNILDARMAEASINTTAGAVDDVVLTATTTSITDINTTGGAVDTVTTVTTTTTNTDMLTAAAVNAEVVDVLKTDTITLPGQEAPPLTPTFEEALSWLYKVFRNRTTQTATLWTLRADDESTIDAQATVSDDATTAIKQEVISG